MEIKDKVMDAKLKVALKYIKVSLKIATEGLKDPLAMDVSLRTDLARVQNELTEALSILEKKQNV